MTRADDHLSWHERIARQLGSHHADTQAVIRAGKKGAKRRAKREQTISYADEAPRRRRITEEDS